jgi:hypothetical protein
VRRGVVPYNTLQPVLLRGIHLAGCLGVRIGKKHVSVTINKLEIEIEIEIDLVQIKWKQQQ